MRTGAGLVLLAALASVSRLAAATSEELREQVRQTETSFAKTMADRDHAGFASFLAEETVFTVSYTHLTLPTIYSV